MLIEKFRKVLISRDFSVSVIVSSIVIFIFGCYYRVAHIDDAWIGEYTYWFSKLGYAKSQLFRGFMGYDKQLLVYHKLFVAQGALLTKYAAFDLYILKSISIFYMLLGCYAFYLVAKALKTDNKILLLAIAFLISNSIVQEYTFVYRPEVMVMSLGLYSYYFILKFLNEKKIIYVIVSAFFAGVCTLAHLNGLIFIAAGACLLFNEKHFKQGFLFATIAGILSLGYLWDVPGKWPLFIMQFTNDPIFDKSSFKWYSFLINFIKESRRFFNGPREIFFSISFLIVLALSVKYIVKEYPRLLYYLLFLIAFLAFITPVKISQYLIYYIPYMSLIIAIGINHYFTINTKQNKLLKYLAVIAIIIAFLYNYLYNIYYIGTKKRDLITLNQQISKFIPIQSSSPVKVLSVMRFVFGELENYDIQCFEALDFICWSETGSHSSDKFNIFDQAARFGNEYIIFDSNKITKYHVQPEKKYPYYQLIGRTDGLYIYHYRSQK